MTKTIQYNVRLDPFVIAGIRAQSKRDGVPQSAVIARGISCECKGTGIKGLWRGEWLYCTCRIGIGKSLDDLSMTIQNLQSDLSRMPKSKLNADIRAEKRREIARLNRLHDELDAEWERLGE